LLDINKKCAYLLNRPSPNIGLQALVQLTSSHITDALSASQLSLSAYFWCEPKERIVRVRHMRSDSNEGRSLGQILIGFANKRKFFKDAASPGCTQIPMGVHAKTWEGYG
jgi:hypothetical protein